MLGMTKPLLTADLTSRLVVAVTGPDWRMFLQGLITQDVETMVPGEARFAALLTPQGRVLFDLFVIGREDGCLLDCAAVQREALVHKLMIYRLRAKVAIEPVSMTVAALWSADNAPGWVADPRLPALGLRGYDAVAPTGCARVDEAIYDQHRLQLGVPGPGDWGVEATYPIEANFDLLAGIDFKKGCFVGQETTSRMKRRGVIKNRMAPIGFDGPPPDHGTEVLAGDLRAGSVLSGEDGMAMALLRLDRVEAGSLVMADGRPCRVLWPSWLMAHIAR